MELEIEQSCRLNAYSQSGDDLERKIDPDDIYVPPGYKVEVYAQGLDAPNAMVFTEDGDLLITESGYLSGNPKVLRLHNGVFEIVAEDFNVPISGIAYREGNIYVSHKGKITRVTPEGEKQDIISGLPSNGDFSNSNVVFGTDRKMYFGQGAATNSGVVGVDNGWIASDPLTHDFPGDYILLNGQNYETENILVSSNEITRTGAFSPFGVPNMPYEIKKGVVKASGSILRANLDGSDLELVAWGLRNPARIKFDEDARLYVANHGYDIRGSRPIANAPDEFHQVVPDLWYGWPDYAGGEPVTSPRFQPEGGAQPEFLLTNHPNVPPRPFATFPPYSNIIGFDFNYDTSFGNYGDVYIAEFGIALPMTFDFVTPYAGIGHRISIINMNTGGVTTFAINKSGFPAFISGEGGFGRPIDVVFGPDKAMYVLDLGTNLRNAPDEYVPYTGVIWRISRT